ncbi:uncharacterized protein [Triticum aestivum]|uniref:uncharacterized protein n=1 Tax=Triticum aestivum TaxID=4565 RepID=UPI000843C47B|nr:uncharacterized protein LOC123149267 [Triticum aestivum]
MWISWSDDNPGRRYKTCAKSRTGGCEMYVWHDDRIEDPFLKQLLIDLRDRVRHLERINSELRDAASVVAQHRSTQLELPPAPIDNLAMNQGPGYVKGFALFMLLAAFCCKCFFG